jgi:hypothetical protein
VRKIIGNTVGTTMNPTKIAEKVKPLDLKNLLIQGDENGGSISAFNPEDPTKSYLELRTYLLSIYASVVNIDATLNVTGFLNAYGINMDDDSIDSEQSAVNKKYVDELVGNIETVLDAIIAQQNSLIGGEA